MSVWYVDTSAAIKLIVEEVETAALLEQVSVNSPVLTSCRLLETELRRFVGRDDNSASQEDVDALLDTIAISSLTDQVLAQAGRIKSLPGRFLRSLDAIHLVAATRIGADAIVTYDANLQFHAAALGIKVIAPGV